jgi:hypothetical protein
MTMEASVRSLGSWTLISCFGWPSWGFWCKQEIVRFRVSNPLVLNIHIPTCLGSRGIEVEGIDNAPVIIRHMSVGITTVAAIKLIITNSLNSVHTKK